MKKIVAAILAIVLNISFSNAQEGEALPKHWTKKGSLGVNFTNVGLINWAGGGENSFSASSIFKYAAEYKKDKVTWNNDLQMAYGLIRQGDVEEFRKSDDRFIFISKFDRKFGDKNLAYAGLFDFRTQMDKGFSYGEDDQGNATETLISRLFAPAYLTVAAGVSYKPKDNFTVMFSPLTGKLTFVLDDELAAQSAFGVDSAKNLRAELGAILTGKWKTSPMENVKYETGFTFFQSYEQKAALDIMWDNLIIFKVNKYISSTFSTNLIWDKDVIIEEVGGPAVQFKHVFTIGFLANF